MDKKREKNMATASSCHQGHAECVLNSQQILYLAEKTAPRDWKKLLLNQDIDQHILQQVECDFESEGCVEIAYQGFQKWKQRFPEKVSVCNVLDSLSIIGRNDIANAFVDKFSVEGTIYLFCLYIWFQLCNEKVLIYLPYYRKLTNTEINMESPSPMFGFCCGDFEITFFS